MIRDHSQVSCGDTVHLDGAALLDVPAHERINLSRADIPQHPGIFRDMSVEDNLMLGA